MWATRSEILGVRVRLVLRARHPGDFPRVRGTWKNPMKSELWWSEKKYDGLELPLEIASLKGGAHGGATGCFFLLFFACGCKFGALGLGRPLSSVPPDQGTARAPLLTWPSREGQVTTSPTQQPKFPDWQLSSAHIQRGAAALAGLARGSPGSSGQGGAFISTSHIPITN
jgi:hypothetical protein